MTARSADLARAPISQLELTVLRRLDGLLQGDHLGLVPGHGSEMGEAREYQPGDDPRRMDWAVTARTGLPHVRDTIADHELELWVVADRSSSLSFGTALVEKHDVAWAACGVLALLAAKGGNRVGLVSSGGSRVTLPARGGRAHVSRLLSAVHDTPADGEGGDLTAALNATRRAASRRGMVAVVSDFLVAPGWERPLRALASRHTVLAVEVIDPRELDLPDVGWLHVVDPESGRQRHVDTRDRKLRDRYAEEARRQRAETARLLASAGAEHVVLRTDRDWVVDLARFVAGRRRRLTATRSAR